MATLSPVYRDDDVGARVRYAELLALWNDRRPELLDASAVHAVRVGRAWAGSVGIASAALLVIATLVRFVGGDRFAGLPTLVLLAAWAAVLVALLAGRALARSSVRAFVDPPRRTADIREDVRRLSDAFGRKDLRDRADALERASVARPMMALALLAPLTIHLVVYALFRQRAVDRFDTWIATSLVVVGHAHMVLAYLAWRFAKRMRALTTEAIAEGAAGRGFREYGYTVLASAIPSALLYLLPPILTAATGLLFVRPMFRAMTDAVVRERRALGVG